MFKCSLLSKSIALSLAITASNIALAEDTAAEKVTVWGTVVNSNSVYLGDTDIAIKQADHLSDLLRDIPGVDIGGTHSTNARINFRGLDDRDLSVYIDGASQKNYLFHHLGNLLVNTDILKSAEIDLGANSVINDGLGGSIRFETKDAKDLLDNSERDFGARLMAGYNSNSQHSYSFTGYGQLNETFDALVYFSHVDRDNFEDGTGTDTIGSDGETDNVLFKLGADLTDTQRLELSYERISDSGDYTLRPDMGVRFSVGRRQDILLPTDYERESINIGYELKNQWVDARITAYTNDINLTRDETTSRRRGVVTGASDNFGLNVLAVSALNTGGIEHTFTYGMDYFDQELSYILAGTTPTTETGETLALFIQDRINFDNSLVVIPGIRYTDFEQNIKATGSTDSWDETTFALAAEYTPVEGLKFLANYTELFKAPELAEVFANAAGDKIINPELSPETGNNIEVGVRYSTELGRGFLNLGFNVFETTIDDYITEQNVLDAAGEDSGQDWDFNVGTATIDGIEASVNYGIDDFDVLFTYAKSDLDTGELEIQGNGDSLREIGDSFSLAFGYDVSDNFNVNYDIQYTAEKTTSTTNLPVVKPSYQVHNLSARLDNMFGNKGLSATFGVDNLFDEFYTSHASRLNELADGIVLDDVEAGRNIKLSVAYIF